MSKKFALILWSDTKEISTVESRDVRKEQAKWNGKWYACKVLKESGE